MSIIQNQTSETSDKLYMQPIEGPDHLGVSILNSKGDVYIIQLKFDKAELVVQEEENPVNGTKRKKKPAQTIRIPKTISLHSVETFNMWDIASQTSDSAAVDQKKSQNVPVSLEFFGRGVQGNFIITDNTGYIYIFRRAIQDKKNNSTESQNEFKMISNTHSGFENIEVISRHQSFQVFSQGSTMGFLRAIDGQIAKSSCEVGNHRIISITHDLSIQGRFYVGIDTGDVIVFTLATDKQKIGCNIEGKIAGDELAPPTDKNNFK